MPGAVSRSGEVPGVMSTAFVETTNHIMRHEYAGTRGLRGLAFAARATLAAPLAEVVAIHRTEHEDQFAVFGPEMERDAGTITFGPRVAELPNIYGEVVDAIAAASPKPYSTIMLHDVAGGESSGIVTALAVTGEKGVTLGFLVVRRDPGLSKSERATVGTLGRTLAALLEGAPPTVVCDRCERITFGDTGLVSFVGGTWIVGHKRCYSDRETPMWFGLCDVQESPVWYTRVATTAPNDCEHLTVEAVRAWYVLVERVTGVPTLPRDGGDEPIRLSSFAVTDPDED